MVLSVMRSRKFSKRVLAGLLLIIIPAFVFWGVGSIADRPQPAGRILGRTISAENFRDSLRGVRAHMILNYFAEHDQLRALFQDQHLMNTMAWERLLMLMSAKEEGLKVSNREVMFFIASHPLFQRDGAFDNAIYNSILRNPAIALSPRQFEELVRENLLVMKFRDRLTGDITVSDQDIRERYFEHANRVTLSYFLLDKEVFAQDVEVSEQEVLDTFERTKDRLFSHEKAQAAYIKVPYSTTEERERVSLLLEDIHADIGLKDFSLKEIAAEAGLEYGETGSFAREDPLPETEKFWGFSEAAFALRDGETSHPLFSHPDSGYAFLIKRTGRQAPRPLSLDEARDRLAEAIRNVKSLDMAEVKAEALFEDISSGAITFEDAALSADAEIISTAPLSVNSEINDLAPARELVTSALEKGEGGFPEPMVTFRGMLLTRVDNVHKASEEDLTDEIKSFIRENMMAEKRASVMTEWLGKHSADVEIFRPLE